MEKDQALGSVAELKLSLAGGKAVLEVCDNAGVADVAVKVDATKLVNLLFAAIEKASPAGAVPIEESVKAVVKASVAAIQ